MIRILNRPLLKEWTTVKSVADSTRSFSRCRKPFSAAPYALFCRNARLPSLSFAQTSTLYYSTVPDQTNVKTKPDPPLPSASISKKPKVDLRPAPKKASQDLSSNVLPRPPPTSPLPESASSSTTSATPIPSHSSSSKTMQQSVAEATKHGVLAPPPAGVGRVGRLWHQFLQMVKFYWAGLKMIFVTHRQQANDIRRRVAEAKAKGDESGFSRWETRFLQTYNRDLVKMVPFVLTLIILEEALPFIVMKAPRLLPSTCLLDSQRQIIEAKRRAKQAVHLEEARAELRRLGQHVVLSSTEKGAESLPLGLARAISGAFSRPTWGPLFLQRRRIEKRLAFLSSDDALLVKEGMGTRLKEEELIEALEERGLIPDSRTPQHLQRQLQWWLKGAHDNKARLALVLQAAIRKPEREKTGIL